MTFIVSYTYTNFIFLKAQQAPGDGNHAELLIQLGSGWHGHKPYAKGQRTRVPAPDLLSASQGMLGPTLLIHKVGTSVTIPCELFWIPGKHQGPGVYIPGT